MSGFESLPIPSLLIEVIAMSGMLVVDAQLANLPP